MKTGPQVKYRERKKLKNESILAILKSPPLECARAIFKETFFKYRYLALDSPDSSSRGALNSMLAHILNWAWVFNSFCICFDSDDPYH